MPPDDNVTEIGQGYHALYHNIQVRRAYGYGVISGAAVSPGSDGDVSVDVSDGTVLYDGTVEQTPATTSLSLATPDATAPRKDIIIYDGSDVAVVTGEPNAVDSAQSSATRFETYQPSPPDGTSQEMVVLAEVWVAPNADTIGSADINDLRTDPDIQTNALTASEATIAGVRIGQQIDGQIPVSQTVAPGATLDVPAGYGVTVAGPMTVDGDVTADGTLTVAPGPISGDGSISGDGQVHIP
jgi:hypothetical protein